MNSHILRVSSLAVVITGLMLAPTTQAQVSLVSSAFYASNIGSTEDFDFVDSTHTITSVESGSFDANGVDKLVVSIGSEGLDNGAQSNDVISVTYGGAAMSMAIERYGNGNRGGEIWYLDNVAVTGDFVITYAGATSGLGFGAYALSGTAAGVGQTASTTATSESETNIADMEMTASAGDFIVAGLARNNFDNGGGIGVVAPLTELFYASGIDGASAASAYQEVTVTGPVNPQIFRLSNNVGALYAAIFEAEGGGPGFLLGDTNNDGTVDTLDIDPFVLLLTDPAGYATAFPGVDPLAVGDINMDTVVDTLDIDPFVALLTAGSLTGGAVPEPGSIVLLGMAGAAGLALVVRRK